MHYCSWNIRYILRLSFHSLKIAVSNLYIFTVSHRIMEEIQLLFNNQSLVNRPAESESAINIHLTKHRRQGQDFNLLTWRLSRCLQISDRPGKVC